MNDISGYSAYIGLDGHIYVRIYGYLVWRSPWRVNQVPSNV